MYREQTEPDAGRTGTKSTRPDTRSQAQGNRTFGGRGATALAVMFIVSVAGYILMFAALDYLIKG